MSVLNTSSARSVFKLLSGASPELNSYTSAEAVKILKGARPATYAVTLKKFERCRTRFAKACQRYEQGPQSLKDGVSARFLQTEYLAHMGQAMPFGTLMPVYFHNARWPFQFARQEEALSNPFGDAALSAMAQLRGQQALLLWQLRSDRQKPHSSAHVAKGLVTWRSQQVEANYALLKPLEPVRHALRQQALDIAKKGKVAANVILLRREQQYSGPKAASM